MAFRVVIVGAGTGGTMLANRLAARLRGPLRRKEVTVTLVGERDEHAFQPGNLDVAFRGKDPARFLRPQRQLVRRAVRLQLEPARRIHASARTVVTASGTAIGYDWLVLATGAEARPEETPGLAECAFDFHQGPREAARIWQALRGFNGGRVVVAIAQVPFKCPPSPNEAVFLLDRYFRKRGIRHCVDIKLVTPFPRAYPAAPVAEVLAPLLASRNIDVVPLFNVSDVDPAARRLHSLEGESVPFDLLIAVPPHRGAAVVRESGLGDEEGWIPVDPRTLRVSNQERMFAIGDAAAVSVSKSGVVAHLQAEVVLAQLVALAHGGGTDATYDGRINCPMELGDGRGLFVTSNYARAPPAQRPRRYRYWMKRVFARMYWRTLGGRYEWIFRTYFRLTRPRPAKRPART